MLPNYQSVYRDPQSVAINQELRERFLSSFAADDELAAAVDGMQSTDFEGDLNRKNQLAEQYNTKLDDRASRGDYETMGMNIARDARSFVQDYTPLRANKEKYDAWMAKVDEMEKLGEDKGGLNATTAQQMRAYGKHGYSGLEYDAEGRLNEDSYFSGPKMVGDVNLFKRMQEEMKDVVARSWSTDIESPLTGIEFELGDDGKPKINHYQSPDGEVQYWVRTKNGVQQIPAELVDEATRRVLKSGDVQASLTQKAMLNNYTLDQINPDTGQMVASDAVDNYEMELEEAIAELQGKGALSEKEESQLNSLQERLNYVRDNREEYGDMAMINNLTKSGMEDEFARSNRTKYSYQNTEFIKSYEVDPLYKMSLQKTLDRHSENVSILTETQEVDPLGGMNQESKLEYIDASEELMRNDLSELQSMYAATNNMTVEEAASKGMYTDNILHEINLLEDFSDESLKEIADKYGMDVDLFREKSLNILLTQQKRDLVKQKIRDTEQLLFGDDYNSVVSDEWNGKGVEKVYKDDPFAPDIKFTITTNNIREALISKGLLPKDASIKDAMDYYINADKQAVGGSAYGGVIRKNVLDNIIGEHLKARYPDLGSFDNIAGRGETVPYRLGVLASVLGDRYADAMRKNNKAINKEFDKTVKTDLGWNMNWFGNQDESDKVMEAFKNRFSDNSWAATIKVTCSTCHKKLGRTEPVLATTLFGKMDKLSVDNVKVSSGNVGLLSVSRADGKSMIVIPIVDEEGNAHNLYADASQFKNQSLDAWISSAEYTATKMWQDGVQANLPADKDGSKLYTPHLLNGAPSEDGSYDKTNKIIFDYGKNLIRINGTWMEKEKGLAWVANLLHQYNIAKLHGNKESVDETAFDFMKGNK